MSKLTDISIDTNKVDADHEFNTFINLIDPTLQQDPSLLRHYLGSEIETLLRSAFFCGKNAGTQRDLNFIFALQEMSQKIQQAIMERIQS